MAQKISAFFDKGDQDAIDYNVILPFLPFGTFEEPFQDVTGVSENINLQRLYSAYMTGSFPWFDEDEGECVIYHSPDPRFCLKLEDLHIPKSIDKFLKKTPYKYTLDLDFSGVITGCREMSRKGQDGTWIGQMMIEAYTKLFDKGLAHSVEVWGQDGKLTGGLYGVLIGKVFFGESMFTKGSDSAKSAFTLFARAFRDSGGKLIDSQVYTDNIARYGAKEIPRDEFLSLEKIYLHQTLTRDISDMFNFYATNPGAKNFV